MATFTDDQLRRLVRQVIDQHLPEARTAAAAPAPLRTMPASSGATSAHPSHLILVVEDAGDGPCVIEPALPCTHCGYCKSLGH